MNEPPEWSLAEDRLEVVTGGSTDFWRQTHYGFVRDSGHFFYREAAGDFTATVRFHGDYETLYDQAGLMLRLDAETWIKAGIEYSDGVQNLSVVVTRGFSDWSVLPLNEAPDEVWLRVSRHGDAVRVEGSLDGIRYQMVRLAYLPPGVPVQVGPMACSPQRSGFRVAFESFRIGEPISPELHAG